MENETVALKAIADNMRMKIVKLLLRHDYCVGALARHLELTEPAISQHLKVLREAGLLVGERRGYFMHYNVKREELLNLSAYFKELAETERETAKTEEEKDRQSNQKNRPVCRGHIRRLERSQEVQRICDSPKAEETED